MTVHIVQQNPQILYVLVDGDDTVWPTHEPLPQDYYPNLDTFSQFIGFGNEGSSPPIGFCTGREISYMVAATRSLILPNCWSILENGICLYNLVTRARINHPLLTREVESAFREIRSSRIPEIVHRLPVLKVYLQKEVHVSLEPDSPHINPADYVGPVTQMLFEFARFVDVTSSGHAIDILVKGINKGSGMIEMCNVTGIPPEQILVIGDSPNDFSAMALAGYVGCPANASEACKKLVESKGGYVSPHHYVVGVVDIISNTTSQEPINPRARQTPSSFYYLQNPSFRVNTQISKKIYSLGQNRGGNMPDRIGTAARQTAEVDIAVELNLDGGPYEVSLAVKEEELNLGGLPIYEHFLEQVLRHGELGGKIKGHGDTTHHLLEDVGGCVGDAIAQAIGDGSGMERMWYSHVPLDGSFAEVALDFGGRGNVFFNFENTGNKEIAGMIQHMLTSMAHHGHFEIQCTIGRFLGAPVSIHHQIEALCKALGRAIHHATRITRQGGIPSTKGTL